MAPIGRNDYQAAWDASVSNAAWLTLSPETGEGRGRFTFTISELGLTPGDHEAIIRIDVKGVAEALEIPLAIHAMQARGHLALGRSETRTSLGSNSPPVEDSVAVVLTGPQADSVEWRATHTGSDWLDLPARDRSGS